MWDLEGLEKDGGMKEHREQGMRRIDRKQRDHQPVCDARAVSLVLWLLCMGDPNDRESFGFHRICSSQV